MHVRIFQTTGEHDFEMLNTILHFNWKCHTTYKNDVSSDQNGYKLAAFLISDRRFYGAHWLLFNEIRIKTRSLIFSSFVTLHISI